MSNWKERIDNFRKAYPQSDPDAQSSQSQERPRAPSEVRLRELEDLIGISLMLSEINQELWGGAGEIKTNWEFGTSIMRSNMGRDEIFDHLNVSLGFEYQVWKADTEYIYKRVYGVYETNPHYSGGEGGYTVWDTKRGWYKEIIGKRVIGVKSHLGKSSFGAVVKSLSPGLGDFRVRVFGSAYGLEDREYSLKLGVNYKKRDKLSEISAVRAFIEEKFKVECLWRESEGLLPDQVQERNQARYQELLSEIGKEIIEDEYEHFPRKKLFGLF